MTGASIKIEGLDKAIRKLERLGTMKPVERGLKVAAVDLKGKVAVYPPQKRMPQPFKTAKQRRYFFWALGEGKIEVPYHRGISPGSEALGRKSTWQVGRVKRLSITVGADVSYGPYVMDRHRQSRYMKAKGWHTIQDVAEDNKGRVAKIIKQSIDKALEDR